ncbi:MAG: DUF6531 domain-containing protein, partial [Roseiarcus sp.]
MGEPATPPAADCAAVQQQVPSRAIPVDPVSRDPDNANATVIVGACAAPDRAWYEKAWDGAKHGFEQTVAGVKALGHGLADTATAGLPYMEGVDPETSQALSNDPEVQAATARAGQFWSGVGSGLADNAQLGADLLVPGHLATPDGWDAAKKAAKPVVKEWKEGGVAQAGGYILYKALETVTLVAATDGAGKLVGSVADEAAAGAKVADAAADGATDTAAAGVDTAGAAPVVAGEPVSVANGEYLETWRDYLIPGALGFEGSRYMGLKLPDAERWIGPLGPCQICAFDEYFDNFAPGKLAFHQADGKRIAFDRPFNFLPAQNAAY